MNIVPKYHMGTCAVSTCQCTCHISGDSASCSRCMATTQRAVRTSVAPCCRIGASSRLFGPPRHAQALYCQNFLGIDDDKINVNGGAIALGHPLGCTGARCTATLLSEMAKRGSRYGVVSMCIGSGMGAAGVFERE